LVAWEGMGLVETPNAAERVRVGSEGTLEGSEVLGVVLEEAGELAEVRGIGACTKQPLKQDSLDVKRESECLHSYGGAT
jgi:hypothetical protein